MPSIQRLWNSHDKQTILFLLEQKRERDKNLIDLFQEIRHELPKKAEERTLDNMLTRITELQEEEVDGYTTIQRIIEKHNHTLWGALTVSSAKSFGFCMAATGIMGTVVSTIELSLERFADQDDAKQNTITTGFTIAAVFFTAMGILGFLIQLLAQKAINKVTKYRDFTWQERKELKILVKYFQEMRSLQQTEETRESLAEDRLVKIKKKFQLLLDQSAEIPQYFGNVTLFYSKEEMINFLLLSLPKDHPIREKLDILEHYATDGILPEAPVPLPSIEVASHGTTEEDDLKEPGIDILPDQSESSWDPDFLLNHVKDMINSGQTFEKGVLRGLNEENFYVVVKNQKEKGKKDPPENLSVEASEILLVETDEGEEDSSEHLSVEASEILPMEKKEKSGNKTIRPEVEKLIRSKQALCDAWIELEKYPGIEKLRNGFTEIRIGELKIPRYKVFREMPHQDYKRKSSLGESLV